MLYYIAFGIIFFATVAMMVQNGLWNNLVKTLAIVIGGLTAFGVFQPLVIMADEATDGAYTYLLDPIILAAVFALVVGLIEQLAQMLSKTRVAFPEALDKFGGVAVALVAAYVMCGFLLALLHTAPLSRDAFGGKFILGDTRREVEQGLADQSGFGRPDLLWLGFAETMLTPARWGAGSFNASVYVHTYAEHRKVFESIGESIVKRG